MSNSNPKYFLRPEAGPVPFDKLQWRAQDALKSIVDALGAAVDSAVVGSEGRGSSSSIDRNRASRLFFVSGEPGSGKSTLYVTLRAMLSKEYHEEYSNGYGNYKGSQELKGLIDRLRGVVRWLEPIDLEVVGDKEENLLAAVLVRLNRELTESGSGFSSVCDGAIKQLEELAADIGMAWEGNLSARAGELDPDSYSMEVMRAQQARIRVNERLREALDQMAENNCYGCDSSTLFVLPVDDLYLKPDASLQLLRLLRMISVPRLFFLIMGDITTVEALFTEKALADWTSVAGAEVFRILPDRLHDALARARELRARFLRKLLPPGQRTEIQPMDWYEAMKFSPRRLDGETLGDLLAQVKLDKPWTPSGEASSTQAQNNKQGNLFDFLSCSPLTDRLPLEARAEVKKIRELIAKPDQNERKSREAYTGLQLLDATPREVMDLWSALHEFMREKERRKKQDDQCPDGSAAQTPSQDSQPEGSDNKIPLLSLVLDFVRLIIDEQNFLNEKEQSAVLNGVLPTRRYYDPDTYLNMDYLRLEPESGDWEKVSDKVWVRKHRPWKLRAIPSAKEEGKSQPVKLKISADGWQLNATAEYLGEDTDKFSESRTQQTRGEFNMLPPRPTAWLILLHDLAWMWRRGSMNKTLVERLRRELKDQLSDPKLKDRLLKFSASDKHEDNLPSEFPGWAAIRDDSTQPLEIPEFIDTVRDLDCFLRVWNRGLDSLFPGLESGKGVDKSDDEARLSVQLLWVFAGWTVKEWQYHHFANQDDKWFKEGLRAVPTPEPEPKDAQNTQGNLEDWQKALFGFRENTHIKKCLRRLSGLQNEAGTTSSSIERNFNEWAEELLAKACPNDSTGSAGETGSEPCLPAETESHDAEPNSPTGNADSRPKSDGGRD